MAFLAWQRTWSYGAQGLNTDYTAAKEALEKRGIDEAHIDTLYLMKLKWEKGRSEQKSENHD